MQFWQILHEHFFADDDKDIFQTHAADIIITHKNCLKTCFNDFP